MTVAATARKAGPTPGNSLATVFPFAFKVFVATDIRVQQTVIASGVISTLVLNDPLGYTVSLNPDQNANPGGSITYNPLGVPMPATLALTIDSVVPQVQGTHIINGGSFFANNLEDMGDKILINVQDLTAKVASSIQFPSADSSALNAILPAAAQRANLVLGFDALGNVIVTSGGSNLPISAAMTAVVQAATLALGRAALGFSAFFDSLITAANAAAFRVLIGVVASPLTTKGDLWNFAGADARLAVGANGQVLTADSVQASGLRWDSATPRSYLAGFGLTNSVSDLVNNIDIAPGACRSAANDASIVLAATLTKQLSAVWAVGNNQGMRASGAAIANTTYAIFAIRRPDTGVVDIAADTSVTGANIAANTNAAYTQIRRIGFIVRAGATIVAFIQNGDDYYWSTPPASDFNAAGSNVAALQILTVPIGAKVKAYLTTYVDSGGAGNQQLYLSDPACADVNPAVAGGTTPIATNGFNGAANQRPFNQATCWTDTSGRIRHRETNANVVAFAVLGWMDRRGRDD